jgi:two-component system, NarL family, nitrate/nitrite response regulator NarL
VAERCRLLIVDDHPVVRRGLRAMLEHEAWVDEVFEAATVADAVRIAVDEAVQVVAMDLVLDDGDGIDAVRRILRSRPGVRVVMLTMTDDEDTVSRALRAGAAGYVLKGTDPDTVIDALRTVAAGGIVLGPMVGPAVIKAMTGAPTTLPPPFNRLTERERTIVGYVAEGLPNSQIARRIGLSEKTIRNQLSTIFMKIGVSGRVEAALLARDLRI